MNFSKSEQKWFNQGTILNQLTEREQDEVVQNNRKLQFDAKPNNPEHADYQVLD